MTTKSSISVVQQITQVLTTKALYLGITLPNNIQCHWHIPSTDLVHIPRPITERIHGCCLSNVPTSHSLIGIMWRDLHQPLQGRIVPVLNYYKGIFQILNSIPIMVSSLTIEADSSLHQILLHPAHSKWTVRFHARRIHAVITNYENMHFSLLHPETAY